MCHDIKVVILILDQYCTIIRMLDQYEFPMNFSFLKMSQYTLRGYRSTLRMSVDSPSRFSTYARSTHDRHLTDARPTTVERRPTAHRCRFLIHDPIFKACPSLVGQAFRSTSHVTQPTDSEHCSIIPQSHKKLKQTTMFDVTHQTSKKLQMNAAKRQKKISEM